VRSLSLTVLHAQSPSPASSHIAGRSQVATNAWRALGRSTYRNVSAVSRPNSVGIDDVNPLDPEFIPLHVHSPSPASSHTAALSQVAASLRALGRSTYRNVSAVSRPISVGIDDMSSLLFIFLHGQSPFPASSHIAELSHVAASAWRALGRSTYSHVSAVSCPIAVGMGPVRPMPCILLHVQSPAPASSHTAALLRSVAPKRERRREASCAQFDTAGWVANAGLVVAVVLYRRGAHQKVPHKIQRHQHREQCTRPQRANHGRPHAIAEKSLHSTARCIQSVSCDKPTGVRRELRNG